MPKSRSPFRRSAGTALALAPRIVLLQLGVYCLTTQSLDTLL